VLLAPGKGAEASRGKGKEECGFDVRGVLRPKSKKTGRQREKTAYLRGGGGKKRLKKVYSVRKEKSAISLSAISGGKGKSRSLENKGRGKRSNQPRLSKGG